MRIPLVGSSYKGVSVALDSQRTRNLMVERADSKDAAAPSALIATPGLSQLGISSTVSSVSPIVALLELPRLSTDLLRSLLFVASGALFRVDCSSADFAATGALTYTTTSALLSGGALDPRGPPIMASNSILVVMVNVGESIAATYTVATGAIAQLVFDATPSYNVPFVDTIHLAGYFLAYTKSGTGAFHYIFYSPDGTNWSSADFFQAEADSSELVKLMEKNGHLWVLKQESIQVFAPTGDSNDPFAPLQSATIQKGCRSKNSVRQIGDYLYFLGSESRGAGLVVYRIAGTDAVRVSNAFVEKILQDIFDAFGPMGINDIKASDCVERGRNLYKLHCHAGKTTLVFDELTSEWHERGWWNPDTGEYEEEIGVVECSFNGRHIVGDRRIGLTSVPGSAKAGIYEQSELYGSNSIWYYTDSEAHDAGVDTFIRRERISPIFSGPNGELLICDSIELLFETGKADANGQGSDPKVTLYVSDDGGNTFKSGRTKSIGKVGKYKDRCQFFGLGSAFKFVFKIVMTDPIAWKLVSAIADLKVAA